MQTGKYGIKTQDAELFDTCEYCRKPSALVYCTLECEFTIYPNRKFPNGHTGWRQDATLLGCEQCVTSAVQKRLDALGVRQ